MQPRGLFCSKLAVKLFIFLDTFFKYAIPIYRHFRGSNCGLLQRIRGEAQKPKKANDFVRNLCNEFFTIVHFATFISHSYIVIIYTHEQIKGLIPSFCSHFCLKNRSSAELCRAHFQSFRAFTSNWGHHFLSS